MVVRTDSYCCWGGDASGMSDPEMCVSGGDLFCLSWVLDAEKVKKRKRMRKKRIRKAKLYSSACYASNSNHL